jgi:RNA polymerase sigma-70 factor, ECF subfamily
MDEKELIKRILDGETNLFSQLLIRYQRPIHSLIRQIVTCREDAEELTQDVFLKAFKSLDKFRGDCSLSTWFYRIAYNTAISATRKKVRDFTDVDENVLNNISDDYVESILEKVEDENLLKRLEAAVERLDIEGKTLISLYYTEDKSVNEIAGILQLSPENVKVKLFRTRKKLVFLTNDGNNGQ